MAHAVTYAVKYPVPGEPVEAAPGSGPSPRRSGRRPASWLLYWLGALPLALGAIVDLPRTRAVGPMTGLGALTVAESAVAAIVLVACARYPRRLFARLAPFAALVGWGVASLAWAPPDVHGLQNLGAYLLLGFAAASAGALAARSRARTEVVLEWAVRLVDVVALGLVAASLARQGWTLNLDLARWLVQPRSVAIVGLVPLAWHLARWYYGRAWELAPAALWVAAIFMSLSRMATATAFVMVATAAALHYRARPRAALVRLAVPGAGLVVALAAVLVVGPFRQRVFRGDAARPSASVALGEAELNDGDRPLFWAHVTASALESPIVGKGIGSSQAVMNERWPGVSHPHNDYLRVWHDLGLVGVVALVAAFVTWGRALARDWWRAERDGGYDEYSDEAHGGAPAGGAHAPAQLELAGLLALIALALPMVTDNAIVYPFVVGPVGVLVGAGLGARALGAGGRRRGAAEAPPAPNGALGNPLDARWAWEPRYPIRRRRRRS